jgi:hypothetical protein
MSRTAIARAALAMAKTAPSMRHTARSLSSSGSAAERTAEMRHECSSTALIATPLMIAFSFGTNWYSLGLGPGIGRSASAPLAILVFSVWVRTKTDQVAPSEAMVAGLQKSVLVKVRSA